MNRLFILHEKNYLKNRIMLLVKIKYMDIFYETALPFIEKMCIENNYDIKFEKFKFKLAFDLCKNEIMCRPLKAKVKSPEKGVFIIEVLI
jgi:hypothetical protein